MPWQTRPLRRKTALALHNNYRAPVNSALDTNLRGDHAIVKTH